MSSLPIFLFRYRTQQFFPNLLAYRAAPVIAHSFSDEIEPSSQFGFHSYSCEITFIPVKLCVLTFLLDIKGDFKR